MLRRLAFALFLLILAMGGGRAAYALSDAQEVQAYLASEARDIAGHTLDRTRLTDFYKARAYRPVWNFSGAGSADALEAFLRSAEEMALWHGLKPEPYGFDALRKLASAQDESSRLKLEILVMDVFLKLARDLHGGATELRALYPGWAFRRAALDIPARLAEASDAQGFDGFLESLIPSHPSYHALAQSLAHYRKIAERGGWKPIESGPTLKPGERGPRVEQLRARLKAEEALAFPPDTALRRRSVQARQGKEDSQRVPASPRLKVPMANNASLVVRLSQAFDRLAPLDIAPRDGDSSPAQASPSGVSLGAGISLDPQYPDASAPPERSTPLRVRPQGPVNGGETLDPLPSSPAPEPAREQPASMPLTQESSSPPAASGDPSYYDDALRESLSAWQRRNGLDGDGNAGPKTLEMLNAPVGERMDQIRANMERWRHMPEDFPPERHALVNIADASLLLVEGGKIAYRGPVVVGRVDRKTPFIQSEIRSMIVNPSWHVPAKIAKKDILPKLRRDPHYLEKLGFVIRGNEDDPHGAAIDWENMSERDFTFRLRQSPGDANSLGRIKFDFDNDFAVYMHGTPHPELFDKDRRTFSSGCIRLRDPLDVAEIVLDANPERWDAQKLNETILSGTTRWVAVTRPLPLFVLYETVFVGFDGKLQFRKDVYGYDRSLIRALDGRPL